MGTFTQTTTFVNGATADGPQVNTEIVNLGTSVNDITNAQVNASAAIAISKTALGTYTAPTSWTPTHVGFSADPTVAAYYSQIGKIVDLWMNTTAAGTSNSTGYTITNLPVTPNITQSFATGRLVDNGVNMTPGGRADVTAASTTLTLYVTTAAGAWTASGDKAAFFHIRYTTA